MRSYISKLLPRLRQYSARLDNISLFTNHPWVQIDDSGDRTVFIFRKEENELLVSRNGEVSSCSWEYLDYMNSLLIDLGENRRLYNQGFLDESVMLLRQDGQEDYLLLVNENKVSSDDPERILEGLSQKYLLSENSRRDLQSTEGEEDLSSSNLPFAYTLGNYIVFLVLVLILVFMILSFIAFVD
jgi:hypothetical protein